MTLRRTVLAAVGLALFLAAPVAPAQPLTGSPMMNDSLQADLEARPFPLDNVRLLESPFREAMLRDVQYLLDLDPDRLLHNFRRFAGLKPKAPRYGGWESMGLAGHTLGHYLSALSMYYATSGDERFRKRVNYIVDELARVQRAHGDGYVAGIPGGRELFAEIQAGEIESSGFRLNGVWSPWYTLHKELAGLLDAYWYCENEKALEVAKAFADWAYETTKGLSEAQWQEMLVTEYGGMNEALANLYAVTGEDRYLELSRKFHDQVVLGPLADRKHELQSLHANTQIPKVIGAARQYELIGADSLKTIADFFWESMIQYHTYVIGGNSMDEYLGPPGQLSDRISATTAETCNTYNMLRLTRHLFMLDGSVRYADFYERALYNHILASQDPKKGMFTYYMSLKPGHFKTYSTPTGAFWCCVGTGMENHVKYGNSIYFHDENRLFVNLFIASELEWSEKGLTVRQETDFPKTNRTQLTISAGEPVEMALRLRHPSWAQDPLEVRINGERVETSSQPGSYLSLDRTWHDDDTVEVRFPMSLRVETMPNDDNHGAILYGPIVLGGNLGTEGLPEGGAYSDSDTAFLEWPTPAVPALVADPDRVDEWVEPVPNEPLTFRTDGAGRPHDVTLEPFYRLHHERYTVYWDLFSEAKWAEVGDEYMAEQRRQRRLKAATVETMRLGEMVAENDHNFEGESSDKGLAHGRKYRRATDGGWFSFEIAVEPDTSMSLMCTYWGGDGGQRTFDVAVEGTTLATEQLAGDSPGEFFDRRYPIPDSLTQGTERVTVRFDARPGHTAGRVFGCRTLRGHGQ